MSIFDPETGKLINKDALSSVYLGREVTKSKVHILDGKKISEVIREDTGNLGGYQVEHSSGQVDAQAFPESVEIHQGVE